jgi:trans-AT polyketide synthase/acyltransferase/oxidoreductase domain-containing protein
VKPAFEAAGVRAFIPLNVSAPFHSRYMREPMNEFATFLAGFRFAPPAIPVVANVTARPYEAKRAARHARAADRALSEVARFDALPARCRCDGISGIGPGSVLTKTDRSDQERRAR